MASILWVKLPRYVRWLTLLIQAGLILIITTDLIILAEFGMRLSWHDVVKFGGEFKAIRGYLDAKLTTITGILALIGIGVLLSSWIGHLRAVSYLDRQGISRIMITALACLLLYALPILAHHPLPWLYRNVVEINLPSGVDQTYSQSYQSHLQASYTTPPLNGYETHFLPPLDSMHKETWLKRLGFHNVAEEIPQDYYAKLSELSRPVPAYYRRGGTEINTDPESKDDFIAPEIDKDILYRSRDHDNGQITAGISSDEVNTLAAALDQVITDPDVVSQDKGIQKIYQALLADRSGSKLGTLGITNGRHIADNVNSVIQNRAVEPKPSLFDTEASSVLGGLAEIGGSVISKIASSIEDAAVGVASMLAPNERTASNILSHAPSANEPSADSADTVTGFNKLKQLMQMQQDDAIYERQQQQDYSAMRAFRHGLERVGKGVYDVVSNPIDSVSILAGLVVPQIGISAGGVYLGSRIASLAKATKFDSKIANANYAGSAKKILSVANEALAAGVTITGADNIRTFKQISHLPESSFGKSEVYKSFRQEGYTHEKAAEITAASITGNHFFTRSMVNALFAVPFFHLKNLTKSQKQIQQVQQQIANSRAGRKIFAGLVVGGGSMGADQIGLNISREQELHQGKSVFKGVPEAAGAGIGLFAGFHGIGAAVANAIKQAVK